MEQQSTGILDKSAQLRKRATAKGLTVGLVKQLLDLKSPLHKSYLRTLYCSSVLLYEDEKLTSKYCNNRWCYVCNRIRTAKLIEGYEPVLRSLPELRFVTLTRPNVPGELLREEISCLIAEFRKIRDKLRKHGLLIKGVRKIEITYNSKTDEYHPHFHCMVSGNLEAECLLTEWLARFPESRKVAQDNKEADSGSLKELFKYCSKISDTPPEANDVIFQALRGRRVVQSMGGIKIISEDVENLQSEEYSAFLQGNDVFVWELELEDWVSTEHGYLLITSLQQKFHPDFLSNIRHNTS